MTTSFIMEFVFSESINFFTIKPQITMTYLYPVCLKIWVQCPHNASGYFSIYGEESEYGEHFNARLVTGSTGEVYARTGYLGFLRRTESVAGQTAPGMASEATDISDLSALTINPPPQDTSGEQEQSGVWENHSFLSLCACFTHTCYH